MTEMGVKIRSQKDRIIKMQKEGIRILNIAKMYHVTESTMYKYFNRWGVIISRGSKYEKREFKDKQKTTKRERWKPKYSPELLAQRSINQKTNNEHIHYIDFESQKTRDARWISNILNKAYL